MKVLIHAPVVCFAALSFGAPFMNTVAERSYDIDACERIDLEPRVGPFAEVGSGMKNDAHKFIDSANKGGQLSRASAAGSSARTVKSDGNFHLDRQQPTNADGQHKVAVQLNKVRKGDPSTVGQVAIHGDVNPSSDRVANKLNRSVTTGKETHINHPKSKEGKNTAAQGSSKKGGK